MENTDPHIQYPKVTLGGQAVELKLFSEDVVWLRTEYGAELNEPPDAKKLSLNLEHTARLLAASVRHASVDITAEQLLKMYTPRELLSFANPLAEAIKLSFPVATPAEAPSPSQLVQ